MKHKPKPAAHGMKAKHGTGINKPVKAAKVPQITAKDKYGKPTQTQKM